MKNVHIAKPHTALQQHIQQCTAGKQLPLWRHNVNNNNLVRWLGGAFGLVAAVKAGLVWLVIKLGLWRFVYSGKAGLDAFVIVGQSVVAAKGWLGGCMWGACGWVLPYRLHQHGHRFVQV